MIKKVILTSMISLMIVTGQSYAGGEDDLLNQVKQEMSDRASNRILALTNSRETPKKEIKPLISNICHQAFILQNNRSLEKQASEGEKFDNIDVAERLMFAEVIDYWAEQSKVSAKKSKRAKFKSNALEGLAFEYEGKTAKSKNFTITMRCMDISMSRGWMPEAMKNLGMR